MIRKAGDLSEETKSVSHLLSRSGFIRLVNALKRRDEKPRRQGPQRGRVNRRRLR